MSGIEWLLDTNMVIGLLKAHVPAVNLAEAEGLDISRAATSQISRMELLGFPGLTGEEEASIRDFLANCRVIGLEDAIELKAIELRRSRHLKLPDAIIAATAITYRLHLLTLDRSMLDVLERQC